MKKKLLTFGSYVLVAVLASALTLASTGGIAAGSSKLAQLEDLIAVHRRCGPDGAGGRGGGSHGGGHRRPVELLYPRR